MPLNGRKPHLQNYLTWPKISYGFILLFGLYLVFFLFMYSERDMKTNFHTIYQWIKPKSYSSQGYLVDTSGCKMPDIDPFHPTVKPFYRVFEPMRCLGRPSFLKVINSTVFLDEAVIESHYNGISKITCQKKWIRRNGGTETHPTDRKFDVNPKWTNLTMGVALDEDAIHVLCYSKSKKNPILEEFIPLMRLKKDTEERCIRNIRNSGNTEDRLNVILIGIDSISKLNFIRHFIKTKPLLNKLRFIEMSGYSKVGDNTLPNVHAMLIGKPGVEFKSGSHLFYDESDFIWKHYSQLGFRTLLIEDAPTIATFNYLKNGFKKPPTDYYLRPFTLAVERSGWRKNSSTKYCFGSKLENRVFYDAALNFFDTMGNRPVFAFVFMARLTHDYVNMPLHADKPAFDFLNSLNERNLFNNSLVAFFSDHGLRFGPIRKTYVGKLEENWPFMFLSLPEWFLLRHPEIKRNLRINQHRLSTPFDVHETLLHHLELMNASVGTTSTGNESFGVSLFNEIDESRTCEQANIASHFCTCQLLDLVPTDSSFVREAATQLVRILNSWLKEYNSCSTFYIEDVLEARMANMSLRNLPKSAYPEVLIKISVSPSSALFESTLRKTKDGWTILGDVSRLDRYGDQGNCVEDSWIRKYCVCVESVEENK